MVKINKNRLQRSLNFYPSIRCAILDTSDMIKDTEISDYMRAITYNFLRNNYSFFKHPIYEENSVDKILQSVKTDEKEDEIDLVVVQAYGNFLYDTWKPLEHGYSLFREYCNYEFLPLAQENKFLVMGHILDDQHKDRWFRLHEQCFVINYRMWKELGEPEFGDFGIKPQQVKQAIRSTENFHDSHTPKFLAPGTTQETIKRTGFGWNFINVSLENGLTIPNFDENVRLTKTYVYPEIVEEKEEFKKYFREDCAKFDIDNTQLDSPKAKFLEYQQFTVERSPHAIWVMNTESVDDIKFVGRKKALRNLYSVSAGFKTFAFMRNWSDDTVIEDVNINYFDISQNSLDVRKWLHSEWDPKNFDMYLDFLKENYYDKDIGLITIYEDFDYESENWNAERQRAKEAYETSILRIFNSMDEWYDFFEQIKGNNKTYTQANMIRDWSSLTNIIAEQDISMETDDVIWSSNYITTRYTTWILSYEERQQVFKNVINDLAEKNPDLRLHTCDWDGSQTRGITAGALDKVYKNMNKEDFIRWRAAQT